MQRTLAAVVAALSLIVTTESRAAFHLDLIDEVKSGVGGDPAVQYVEVRVLGGQTVVTNTRLTAFDCDGSTASVLLVVPSNVTNSGSGVRFVMATTSFAAAAGITPDFTWDPAVTGSIPTTCGMVCWGAPGFVPPAPASWSASDPDQYVDCVAYGPYTGPTKTSTHNGTPTSGTPTTLTPDDGTLSLTRVTDTGDNAADFALGCPSPTNNSGDAGDFGPCPPASTTTTTAPPTTTTTSSTTTTTMTSTTTTTSTSTTILGTTTTSGTVTTTSTTTSTVPVTTTTTVSTSTSSTTLATTTTTTTSTTLGAVCGNGVVEPGEQCDPPWSRKPEQCPPLPGRRFGPECGDDCLCLTTTTGLTSSTSSTTEASTTTTSSTTTLPPEEIQCCVTTSPHPAFPEGVSCEFLKPFECDASGGVDMGPGDCDPNPCLGTTTTTLPGLSGLSCARSVTMASVECRLTKLIVMVSEAGNMHGLGAKLLAPLHHAEAYMTRAEQLQALGQSRRARAFLRRAVHDLRIFGKRLGSRRAARLLPASARNVMVGLAEPLRLDLQALVPAASR